MPMKIIVMMIPKMMKISTMVDVNHGGGGDDDDNADDDDDDGDDGDDDDDGPVEP